MSIALLNAAFKAQLPQVQKFVLVALCNYANDAGECFPSVTMLSECCSVSDRSVQKSIVELIATGYLKRDFRRGRSTVYIVADPRTWFTPNDVHPEQGSPHPRTTFTPEQGSPPNDVHPTPERGTPTPERGTPITTTQPPSNQERMCLAQASEADDPPAPVVVAIRPEVQACQQMIAAGIPHTRVSANHPTLVQLIAAGHQPEEFKTAAAYAIEQVGAETAFGYALGIVKRQAAATARQQRIKPSATDSSEGKSYAGTAVEHMPAEFRNAIERAGIG